MAPVISNPSAQPSLEKDQTSKPKGVIKRTAEKVARHASTRRKIQLPNWLLYVGLLLGLIGLVYGVIQQVRIWRWDKLLRAARVEIAKLEAEKKEVKLQITKELTDGRLQANKDKLKKIDQELHQVAQEKKKLDNDVDRMSRADLKAAFRREVPKK